MAPETVLRYLVTHEAVHLAVSDHSAKFWLTVQSHCRDTERAKQWLAANGGSVPEAMCSFPSELRRHPVSGGSR
jgi:predicted metal-dependent hydrolase